jgi:hypothetical protein
MKLLTKILNAVKPKYKLVYRTANGATAMYTITKPKHKGEFGNMTEGKDVVGFKSWCFNRNGFRSFRYDRIVSLIKG